MRRIKLATAKNTSSEHLIQSSFFAEVRYRRKRDARYKMIFAIPSGGKRHIFTARRLKKEGTEPGIPDVCVAVPSGGYHGLWLEFKTPKGVLSAAQKEKINLLRAFGYKVEVVRDAEVAIKIVEHYFNLETAEG